MPDGNKPCRGRESSLVDVQRPVREIWITNDDVLIVSDSALKPIAIQNWDDERQAKEKKEFTKKIKGTLAVPSFLSSL